MNSVQLRARVRTRMEEKFAELMVERAFGYDVGPLFDRHTVSPLLLDEFARSSEVRAATWAFAEDMVRLWVSKHPNAKPLRLAGKRSARVLPRDPAAPPIPEPPANGASTMDTAPDDSPAAAPEGAATPPPAAAAPVRDAPPAPAAPVAERRVTFSIPNARSGEAYRGTVDGKDDHGRPVTVTDVRLPPDLGLAYDPATRSVHGVPVQAGEHPIALRWQDESAGTRSASLVLIVNANPRDLWKTIDADPTDPYYKPNEDAACIGASGSRIAAGSKRGRSHAHAGTCRDDDFFVAHDAASGWSTLIVADGAGASKSSRQGAALACRAAGGHLSSELAGDEGGQLQTAAAAWDGEFGSSAVKPLKDRLYNLFGKAAWAALRAVEDEATTRAAPVKDYSTTLLCAVHRKSAEGVFVASFWLGDGAICAYGPAGTATLMGKPDSGEFAGQTRFLDRAALSDPAGLWSRIQLGRHPSLTALMLMTDGISDPRFETDNGLADAARWDSLWAELQPSLAAPDPGQALVQWMDFFSPGHHDDRTIALLW